MTLGFHVTHTYTHTQHTTHHTHTHHTHTTHSPLDIAIPSASLTRRTTTVHKTRSLSSPFIEDLIRGIIVLCHRFTSATSSALNRGNPGGYRKLSCLSIRQSQHREGSIIGWITTSYTQGICTSAIPKSS